MADTEQLAEISSVLAKISNSLDILANGKSAQDITLGDANAYVWVAEANYLRPVASVNRVPLDLLRGVDNLKTSLVENSVQFARGHSANNVLLWGAKGMGKSSLVKAVHAEICDSADAASKRLILIEISREDIDSLPQLLRELSKHDAQFIIFCDDLSFSPDESAYKSLKSVLDGGLEGRPHNVLFYATSNRRHLMPRDMIDNEQATAISPGEAIDEKVSLSDRFGLWLGFHNCDQNTYLAMINGYVAHFKIPMDEADVRARAIEWAQLRGGRSGRVAMQFVRQIAGEQEISIK